MPLFEWKPEYDTNFAAMDRQHQEIVRRVNELHDALTGGAAAGDVDARFVAVIDATKEHFATEERYMADSAYPGYASHRMIHEILLVQIAEVRETQRAGKPLTAETTEFLRRWIEEHMTATDRTLANYLLGHGVR